MLFKDGVAIEVCIALNNMVMDESERIWKEAVMNRAICRIHLHGCCFRKYIVKLTFYCTYKCSDCESEHLVYLFVSNKHSGLHEVNLKTPSCLY